MTLNGIWFDLRVQMMPMNAHVIFFNVVVLILHDGRLTPTFLATIFVRWPAF